MPVICRLLKLSAEQADTLIYPIEDMQQIVGTVDVYSDVYRYWQGIAYLLKKQSLALTAVDFLNAGREVSVSNVADIPAARLILLDELKTLNAALQTIEPDALIPYYEASELDSAGIYPNCWQRWEETFDPLGQLLEHYFFLQEFVNHRVVAGEALLLYFEFLDDGSDWEEGDEED